MNYDKIYKVIPIPELNDLENLQIWWLKNACFFPSIDPRKVLLSFKTNLLKKQKYFPNSKRIQYINKS